MRWFYWRSLLVFEVFCTVLNNEKGLQEEEDGNPTSQAEHCGDPMPGEGRKP